MRQIHWAANGESEVVLSVLGLRIEGFPVRAVKGVLRIERPRSRIECAVTQEVICRPMESVGSRLHAEIDNSISGFTELGREIALENFEFLHRFRGDTLVPLSVRQH